MAAPKKYKSKDIENILDRFANGEKLKDIFVEKKTPSPYTFYKMINEDAALAKKYAHAREFHAEQFMNEIEQIKDDLRDKKLPYNEARVLADIIKWQACKYYPKMFGDKVNVDNTSSDGSMRTKPNIIVNSERTAKEIEKLMNIKDDKQND